MKGERYCVLDFNKFWEGVNDPSNQYKWDEIALVKDTYFKIFPKPRIPIKEQNSILEEMESRMKRGLPFLRSQKYNKPVLLILQIENENRPLTKNILDDVNKMLVDKNLLTGKWMAENVGNPEDGIFVSIDGVMDERFENYYFSKKGELVSKIKFLLRNKYLCIEKWLNVMINTARRGFSDKTQFELFFKMQNPIKDTPSLFGVTRHNDFFRALMGVESVDITLTDPEYSYALISCELPSEYKGVNLLNFMTSALRGLWVVVTKSFLSRIKDSTPSELYFEIVTTIGLTIYGGGYITAKLILGFILVAHLSVKVMQTQQFYPMALHSVIYKATFDMSENLTKSIWIAAGKGTGKSTIGNTLKDKGYIVIDSDLYGRVLYQMAINKTDPNIGCSFSLDNPDLLAKWIYEFSVSDQFDSSPSLFEILGKEFIERENITIEQMLNGKLTENQFRKFSYNFSSIANKIIKFQDYANTIGFIPYLIQKDKGIMPLVIFTHNTLELFPAMTNAIFKMEVCFQSVVSILTRDRIGPPIVELFLALYYEATEPLIANAMPAYSLIRAISTLPSFKDE